MCDSRSVILECSCIKFVGSPAFFRLQVSRGAGLKPGSKMAAAGLWALAAAGQAAHPLVAPLRDSLAAFHRLDAETVHAVAEVKQGQSLVIWMN